MTGLTARTFRALSLLAAGASLTGVPSARADNDWKAALTLHASFDRGTDADFAKGDARLWTLTDRKEQVGKPGLHTNGLSERVATGGRFGGALRFHKHEAPWIFFLAEGNLPYRPSNWSGTVSVWLQCDPLDGLAPGYCDPVQITPRTWNDAAFFLDFNKEGRPRAFRLGAFADKDIWNPEGGEIPEEKRPLLTARKPSFGKDRWTHVVFTWEGFNNGGKEGRARLYLDGKLNGTLTGWNQQFTWKDNETARLLLGLNYVGLLDEFSCFGRALTGVEIMELYQLTEGVTPLLD